MAFRRLPASCRLSLLLGVLPPLSTDGSHMHALARYVNALFAVFVALAARSLRQRWSPSGEVISEPASPIWLELRDRVVLLPSLLMLAVFTLMFSTGVWAAIRPWRARFPACSRLDARFLAMLYFLSGSC